MEPIPNPHSAIRNRINPNSQIENPKCSQPPPFFLDEPDQLPSPIPAFACTRCHGVIGFSRTRLRKSWNQLILQYSGGLMYGHEVPRPPWLKEERKRAFRKRRPKPHPLQDQVQRLLVETDLTLTQIARELGIKRLTATKTAHTLYRRLALKDRTALRAALLPSPQSPTADCLLPTADYLPAADPADDADGRR